MDLSEEYGFDCWMGRGAISYYKLQTVSGFHPFSYTVGTLGLYPRRKSDKVVTSITSI
jgi:hypothetical protein